MARMNINRFFTEVLGAQLKNSRWSWGARDPVTNRIFLRVWEDQLEVRDGAEWLRVGYGDKARRSNGFAERKLHLGLIMSGADGYGVVCEAKKPLDDGARKIHSFNDRTLAKLGDIRVEGDYAYARIDAYIPVADLSSPMTSEATLASDILAISRMKIDTTTKERLVNARVGQGQFRADVLRSWGMRCAVTGVRTLDAIRASHIKPWRCSSNEERLSAHNGLPLTATLDALFDTGLISFSPEGVMLVSESISAEEVGLLSLIGMRLREAPSNEIDFYLKFHRENVFQKKHIIDRVAAQP